MRQHPSVLQCLHESHLCREGGDTANSGWHAVKLTSGFVRTRHGKWKLKWAANFPAAVCSGDREDLVYSEDILPNQTFHNPLVLYKLQSAQQLPGTLLWCWLLSWHCLKAATSGLLLLAFDPPLKTQHDLSHPPHHLSFTWLSGAICLNHALSPWFGLFQLFPLKLLPFLQPLVCRCNIKKGFCSVVFPGSFYVQVCGSFFLLLLRTLQDTEAYCLSNPAKRGVLLSARLSQLVSSLNPSWICVWGSPSVPAPPPAATR